MADEQPKIYRPVSEILEDIAKNLAAINENLKVLITETKKLKGTL